MQQHGCTAHPGAGRGGGLVHGLRDRRAAIAEAAVAGGRAGAVVAEAAGELGRARRAAAQVQRAHPRLPRLPLLLLLWHCERPWLLACRRPPRLRRRPWPPAGKGVDWRLLPHGRAEVAQRQAGRRIGERGGRRPLRVGLPVGVHWRCVGGTEGGCLRRRPPSPAAVSRWRCCPQLRRWGSAWLLPCPLPCPLRQVQDLWQIKIFCQLVPESNRGQLQSDSTASAEGDRKGEGECTPAVLQSRAAPGQWKA